MAESPPDKIKNRGRERLIRAAQALAEKRAFDEITIDEIIKTAELSRPAFYYHFAGGKEGLRAELVKRGLLRDTPAQDTERAILEAALRIFARSGLSAATLEDIATEAGVTRGTLCWHFHSKDDLLAAIVKHYSPHSVMCTVVDQLEQDLQNGVPLDDETTLHRLADAFYDAFTAQGDYTRLAILLIHTHPEAAHMITERINRGRKSIIEYIRRRQEEGRFCKNIDPGLFMQVMATTFAMPAIGRGLNDFSPFIYLSREELINQLVSLLLYGIVKRDQVPKGEA